MKVNLLC